MDIFIRLLIAVAVSYVIATLWESAVHRGVLHADRKRRLNWRRRGGVFHLLRKAYFSHHIVHHQLTYRTDFFVQFDQEEARERLDHRLPSTMEERVRKNRYGLTISSWLENGVFILIPSMLCMGVFLLLAPSFVWLGVGIAFMPMLLSRFIHPLLHMSEGECEQDLPRPLRTLSRTTLFRWLQRYHFMHHQDHRCNFNLFPGGDFLLGVGKKVGLVCSQGPWWVRKSDVAKPKSESA